MWCSLTWWIEYFSIALRCGHIYHRLARSSHLEKFLAQISLASVSVTWIRRVDQKKAAWYESGFCVSCASGISTLLTLDILGGFFFCLRNFANVTAPSHKPALHCWTLFLAFTVFSKVLNIACMCTALVHPHFVNIGVRGYVLLITIAGSITFDTELNAFLHPGIIIISHLRFHCVRSQALQLYCKGRVKIKRNIFSEILFIGNHQILFSSGKWSTFTNSSHCAQNLWPDSGIL